MLKAEEDILFIACTRPAMVAGVTMEAFAVNGMFTCIVLIAPVSMFYCIIGVFIHFGLVGLLKNDPNRLRVLGKYVETKGRCRNSMFWNGSSVTPNRLYRKYEIEDFLA